MTKEEFTDRVKHITGEETTVADKDYKTIEYVYNFYPTLSDTNGMMQIATLYVYGGMAVINDMLPRASRAHELECEIQEKRASLNVSIGLYKSLKEDTYI